MCAWRYIWNKPYAGASAGGSLAMEQTAPYNMLRCGTKRNGKGVTHHSLVQPFTPQYFGNLDQLVKLVLSPVKTEYKFGMKKKQSRPPSCVPTLRPICATIPTPSQPAHCPDPQHPTHLYPPFTRTPIHPARPHPASPCLLGGLT